MQGLGTVLPALLGWTEIVRMLGRAGNQKSAPVWQNWSMGRTQWMEQTQLLLQDNSLGSGSSVTSRRKHPSAGVNKLIGACVVAELVPFNVPPLPGGSPATLIAREGSLKCSAGRMCLRDLRAVLVKSGDPSRLIHPRSMGACRAQPVAGEGDRTGRGMGTARGHRSGMRWGSCRCSGGKRGVVVTALGGLDFVSLSGVRTQPGHPSGTESA